MIKTPKKLIEVALQPASLFMQYYQRNPFKQKPDYDGASVNYDLEKLLSKSNS